MGCDWGCKLVAEMARESSTSQKLRARNKAIKGSVISGTLPGRNICATSIAPSVAAAQAAVFNIADGDVAGLKGAINTANSNGQDDTINLATNGTYTLTAVDNTDNGANGLPRILEDLAGQTSHSLTINGNGATLSRTVGNIAARPATTVSPTIRPSKIDPSTEACDMVSPTFIAPRAWSDAIRAHRPVPVGERSSRPGATATAFFVTAAMPRHGAAICTMLTPASDGRARVSRRPCRYRRSRMPERRGMLFAASDS